MSRECSIDNLPYKVYTADGRLILQASESCRYTPPIERQLLDIGYVIKLHGKRITKKNPQRNPIQQSLF